MCVCILCWALAKKEIAIKFIEWNVRMTERTDQRTHAHTHMLFSQLIRIAADLSFNQQRDSYAARRLPHYLLARLT